MSRSGTMSPLLAVLVCLLVLAGCGGSGSATSSAPNATGANSDVGTTAGFPVTIQSCGRTLSFKAPPQRVVILNPTISDALFALGVGNRIVGQGATQSYAPLPQYKAAMARVPVISPGIHFSQEKLLAAHPDLVIAPIIYQGINVDQLQSVGIPTYESAQGCATNAGGPVTDIFTDIDNYGTIFGVQAKARALVAKLKGELADVGRRVSSQHKVTVFESVYLGGQYYAADGTSLDCLNRSGGISIFPDAKGNATVSAEVAAARNPQVIIADTYNRPQARLSIGSLKQAFATTDAVKNNRIYFLEGGYFGAPGALRQITGIQQRAMMLYPTAFQR